ncbi:hypothetical protein [Phenylobacterium sp.]|uniref:hypothetical protein n=1 Tax=Phenylobacterium sp. TaxID=1871053 RepID=UPI002DEBCD66|nr:hypothetical protein [Phenylobacterium sp.]
MREAPQNRARPRRAGYILGAAALICAGLWISLHYCLVAWKADPDIFVSVALWRGAQDHGLGFLKTWTYTEDNWLFSLLPVSSLIYSVFGATARVAALVGWLFFVASVGLTGWLTARMAGWRAGLATAVVLLFANYHALGHVGFLGYPITHNVSLAWGLVVLLLAYWGLERRLYGPCLAAGVMLYLDAVSDPWASAAIAAPLILTSGALAVLNRGTRLGGCARALCLVAALALWAAYKHPFGLLQFLRRGHFQPGGWDALVTNLSLGYRALSVMFNIAPGANLDEPRTKIVSLAALAVMVGGAAVLTLLGWRRASPGRQLTGAVSILSIGAVTALYLLGPPNTGMYVARFFPNLYFLGALLIATVAAERWRAWPWALKGLVAIYAALFMASAAAMAPQDWTSPIPSSEPAQARALGELLEAHHLTYGYGPYWGANALAMDTLTGGAVTVRPVVFQNGRVARRPVETSSLWYAPGAEPAGASPFLVIRSDIEGCPATDACEAAARAQFGAPAERLTQGDAVVLVWRRPMAPLLDR